MKRQEVILGKAVVGETQSADNTGTHVSSRIVTRVDELKKAIDAMDRGSMTAKLMVQKLAGEIEKEGTSKEGISRKIKELLQDKIKEGKISAKWIEDCLPKEYKRQYKKSEVSSLLSNTKHDHGPTETIDRITDRQIDDHDFAKLPKGNALLSEVNGNPITERLTEEFSQYVIRRDSLAKIVKALEKCREICYVTVSTNGHLIDIESDTDERN